MWRVRKGSNSKNHLSNHEVMSRRFGESNTKRPVNRKKNLPA